MYGNYCIALSYSSQVVLVFVKIWNFLAAPLLLPAAMSNCRNITKESQEEANDVEHGIELNAVGADDQE